MKRYLLIDVLRDWILKILFPAHMDGSYTAPTAIPPHMLQGNISGSVEQSPAHQGLIPFHSFEKCFLFSLYWCSGSARFDWRLCSQFPLCGRFTVVLVLSGFWMKTYFLFSASFDPFNTTIQPKIGGDIDSAMSSMVQNLNINKAQPTWVFFYYLNEPEIWIQIIL